jgi:hypothetical protein
MRWPHDGPPAPDSGPALLDRIDRRIDPWQKLRIMWAWQTQRLYPSLIGRQRPQTLTGSRCNQRGSATE